MDYRLEIKRSALEQIQRAFEQHGNNPAIRFSFVGSEFRVNMYNRENIDEDYRIGYDESEDEIFERMHTVFSDTNLPKDINELVNSTFNEAVRCFQHGFLSASIILCGKVVESVVAGLYTVITGQDPGTLGFSDLRKRVSAAGYKFSQGIDHHMAVINTHRNKAVHGNVAVATPDLARSTIYLTRDVLSQVMSHP